jgi:WD40 repeat protein
MACSGAALSQEPAVHPADGLFRLTPALRLGDLRWRANFSIHALAFAPDGKALAIAGDHVIGIWDVATGLRLAERKKSDWSSFWSLAWAPDGTLIAAGQDHDVLSWDAAGKLRHKLAGHRHVVKKISLSADGTTLASLDVEPKVMVWDVVAGKLRREFPFKHLGNWPEIVLAPSGKLLATNGPVKEAIQFWDVASGERVRVLADKVTYEQHLKLAFTPDSQRLIAASEGDLRVWEVATGTLRREIKKAYTNGAAFVAVAPDGRCCAVNSGESIKIWDIDSGRLVHTLAAPGQALWSAAFSPDGKTIAAAHMSQIVNLWNADTGELYSPGPGHTGVVDAVAWVAHERVITTSADRSLRTWDANAGRLEKIDPTPAGLLWPRSISADGSTLVGNNAEGGLGVFDVATGKEKATIAPGNWLVPFVPSPRGSLVALNEMRPPRVHLVPTTPTGTKRILAGPDRMIHGLAISADEKLVAIGYEQKYDGEFPRAATVIDGPVKLPPRRKDPTIFVYDAATGKELHRFGESLASVTALAFSPSGRMLAACSEHRLHLLDLHTGKLFTGLATTSSSCDGLALSPDGRLLITRPDMELWEAATLIKVARLEGHPLGVRDFAFSPEGRRLLTGSADTTAAIWDITTMALQGDLPKLQLSQAQLDEHWRQLSSSVTSDFYPALWKLVAAGDASVPLIARNVRPKPHLDPAQLKTWLADLDHEQFARRDEAMRGLERLGPAIEAELLGLLKSKFSLEKQRRVEQLLKSIGPTPERLRAHRALMVLEQIGSPAAKAALADFAKGEPRDPFTREAGESVKRVHTNVERSTP